VASQVASRRALVRFRSLSRFNFGILPLDPGCSYVKTGCGSLLVLGANELKTCRQPRSNLTLHAFERPAKSMLVAGLRGHFHQRNLGPESQRSGKRLIAYGKNPRNGGGRCTMVCVSQPIRRYRLSCAGVEVSSVVTGLPSHVAQRVAPASSAIAKLPGQTICRVLSSPGTRLEVARDRWTPFTEPWAPDHETDSAHPTALPDFFLRTLWRTF